MKNEKVVNTEASDNNRHVTIVMCTICTGCLIGFIIAGFKEGFGFLAISGIAVATFFDGLYLCIHTAYQGNLKKMEIEHSKDERS